MVSVNLPAMVDGYQRLVRTWTEKCFGTPTLEPIERGRRLLEEAIELAQSVNVPAEQARQLVDYVYGRPVGEPSQEVGGVMITLAILCNGLGINFGEEALRELTRIDTPELIRKIRDKQVSKNLHGIGGTPEAAKLNG